MGRVERFKQERQFRKKIWASINIFFIIMAVGVCVVDYSANYIIKNERNISLVEIKGIGNSLYEFDILGYKLAMDIGSISRDFKYVREQVRDLFK